MKPNEPLKTDSHADGSTAGASSNRRTFLATATVAVLSAASLPWLARGAADPTPGARTTADGLVVPSGPGLFGHAHTLLIPRAALERPPLQGVVLTSTESLHHRHEIALTRDELVLVGRGGTIVKPVSSHRFVIALVRPSDADVM